MNSISWETEDPVAMPLCDGLFKTDDPEESGQTFEQEEAPEPDEPPTES